MAFAAFNGQSALLSTALLAYTFGLRHAVDADHIAAIDNVTRRLMHIGRSPLGAGFFFSLGHSTVVVGLTVAVAFAAATLSAHFERNVGSVVGDLLVPACHRQPVHPRPGASNFSCGSSRRAARRGKFGDPLGRWRFSRTVVSSALQAELRYPKDEPCNDSGSLITNIGNPVKFLFSGYRPMRGAHVAPRSSASVSSSTSFPLEAYVQKRASISIQNS